MFSAVASGFFAVRNVDKAQNGDVGRSAVAAGQIAGLTQEIAKYDSMVGKGTKCAVSALSNLAKEHKAFEYAGKVTKFAADNVNPLICVSSGIKTLRSDDKVGTGITETAALAAMFAGEGFVKDKYDKFVKSDACKNMINKASETKVLKPMFDYLEKHKLTGKAGTIIKGLTFVSASMASYAVGEKIGKDISNRVKANLDIKTPKKIDQKA